MVGALSAVGRERNGQAVQTLHFAKARRNAEHLRESRREEKREKERDREREAPEMV